MLIRTTVVKTGGAQRIPSKQNAGERSLEASRDFRYKGGDGFLRGEELVCDSPITISAGAMSQNIGFVLCQSLLTERFS